MALWRSVRVARGQTFWFVVLLVASAVFLAFRFYASLEESIQVGDIQSFADCVKAGNPVQESYPAQCTTQDGRSFAEDIGNVFEKADRIRVSSPTPNQVVSSPLTIEGSARGSWYFEATFPVKLLDADGHVIVSGAAKAEGNWMTKDFVPFRLRLQFDMPATAKGILVFERDNPSGLPQNDDKLEMPVQFVKTGGRVSYGFLTGRVTVSPICPVEKAGVPCDPSPSTYTSREVIVYQSDGTTEVARMHFDTEGRYQFQLTPGKYVLATPQGVGKASRDLPKPVIIAAGQTVELNFTIDTGIR